MYTIYLYLYRMFAPICDVSYRGGAPIYSKAYCTSSVSNSFSFKYVQYIEKVLYTYIHAGSDIQRYTISIRYPTRLRLILQVLNSSFPKFSQYIEQCSGLYWLYNTYKHSVIFNKFTGYLEVSSSRQPVSGQNQYILNVLYKFNVNQFQLQICSIY